MLYGNHEFKKKLFRRHEREWKLLIKMNLKEKLCDIFYWIKVANLEINNEIRPVYKCIM